MKKKKMILAVVALAVLGLLFFSLKYFSSTKHPYLEYQGTESKIDKDQERMQQFIIGSSDIPQSGQVLWESGKTAEMISRFIYESLVSISETKDIEFILAEEISFHEEGTVADVVIRETVFSDGTALTAEKVKEAYLILNQPGSSYAGMDLMKSVVGMEEYQQGTAEDISGIEVLSEKQLRFQFQDVLLNNMQVFSMPVIHKIENKETYSGTGPYQIESVKGMQEIILSENTYAKKNPYEYSTIRFVNMPLEVLNSQMKEFSPDAVIISAQTSLDLFKQQECYDIYGFPSGNYSYIGFSPDCKKSVQEAVCAVTDPAGIYRNIRSVNSPSVEYMTAEGITAAAKGGESFRKLAKGLNAEKLSKTLREQLNGATLKFLCPDNTIARMYYKEFADQFGQYDIKVEGIFVDAAKMQEYLYKENTYDFYFSYEMSETPKQIIEKNYDKDELKSLLKTVLERDCKKMYDTLEETNFKEKLIVPVDVQKQYLAVLSDCHNKEMLSQLLEW
ncbi:ABC transporter substrate-binding protein [Brotonthovivens ammoniilytica]|uniref:ABC transporter substrate-binding protein n=1 Tax=Brotonthovivens ammoniilytica TaxID=2981725 RepID=A0ABT2TGM7_9FIRM|nr:ABC transporter substrate-binding protein [Brotonthovivens ammoniilytica]MCU6761051.1 ABC transporter substrate-binding protein [Brotonthovivens ammoniilytica]